MQRRWRTGNWEDIDAHCSVNVSVVKDHMIFLDKYAIPLSLSEHFLLPYMFSVNASSKLTSSSYSPSRRTSMPPAACVPQEYHESSQTLCEVLSLQCRTLVYHPFLFSFQQLKLIRVFPYSFFFESLCVLIS